MRISDWSSDVCSSDLDHGAPGGQALVTATVGLRNHLVEDDVEHCSGGESHRVRAKRGHERDGPRPQNRHGDERKSVVTGKSVSVRVGLGGRRIIKKKRTKSYTVDTATLYATLQ